MGFFKKPFGGAPPTIRGKILIEDVMLEPKPHDARTVFRSQLLLQLGLMPGMRLRRLFDVKRMVDTAEKADTIIQLIWDLLPVGRYQGTSQLALLVVCEVRILHNKPTPTVISRKIFKGSSPPEKITSRPLRYQKPVLGDVPWSDIEEHLRSIPLE